MDSKTEDSSSSSEIVKNMEGLNITPYISQLPLRPPRNVEPTPETSPESKSSIGIFRRCGAGDGPRVDNNIGSEAPLLFREQCDIGHFMTGEADPPTTSRILEVEHEVEPEVLLPLNMITAFNGKYLGIKFDESKKITDYKAFHMTKQMYFYRWLVDHRYFQNIGTDKKWKKPDFISNEGRIVDIFLTPFKKIHGWEFYAIKYADIIFISNVDFGNRQSSTTESHCGYVYRQMITGGDPESEIIDEFSKLLAATQVSFGDHQLLVVSETDGLNDQGDTVKIRAYKPVALDAPDWVRKIECDKFLKFWAVSIVPGVKSLVLGHRDQFQCLQSTSIISLDDVWEKNLGKGKERDIRKNVKQRCYSFTNRFMNFIKSEFKENDRFLVKHFKWEGLPRNDHDHKDKNGRKESASASTSESENPASGMNEAGDGSKKMEGAPAPTLEGAPKTSTYVPPHLRNQKPHQKPYYNLDEASVICTIVVDPEQIKTVSSFILPDWFVDAAFKQQ